MVKGRIIDTSADPKDKALEKIKEVIEIRKSVFDTDFDEKDISASHVLIFDNDDNRNVACGRIYMNDSYDFVIDNVAVLENYRNKKYGDFVIRMLVDKAFSCAASIVYAELFHSDDNKMLEQTNFLKKYNFKETDSPYLLKLNRKDYCTGCGHGI